MKLAILAPLATVAIMPASATATASPIPSRLARTRALIERCDGDHVRFSEVILGESGYWEKQREVLASVRDFATTLVPAGNSVGKSFMAGRLILSFLSQYRDSIVFSTGPTQGQLNKVVWGEVASAIRKARIPLGVEPKGTAPVMLSYSPRWFGTGHVTSKIEAATGYHREHLLVLVDEGSGVSEAAYEAAWSLNPSRIVVFGNPLHPHGRFHELCRRALEESHKPDRTSNLIRIPSTSSPDIAIPRSKRGLADLGFLERSRRDYGEGSLWWISHILAQFPDVTSEQLIPPDWADAAAKAPHVRSGPARIAIDLAGGNGGDRSVALCRDDNGLLDLRWSNLWGLEETARVVGEMAQVHRVAPGRVSWDLASLGADFGARLAAVGLADAVPYLGGHAAENAANLRSAAARELRWRLDPQRMVASPAGVLVRQAAFSFNPPSSPGRPYTPRPDWYGEIRPELVGVTRFLDKLGRYQLELSADMRARLKRSPDFFDALCQSFAFPEA